MAWFDTGHGNLEDLRGDRPAVEQLFLQLHYRRISHVHLLATDGVQYGDGVTSAYKDMSTT